MDDILASADLGEGRSVHVATLSNEAVTDSGAEHLGFGGYFIFEVCDLAGQKGIEVLGKAPSFDAAMRLIEVFKLH